jgi:quercetin dioxygenase-like cupin family protein
MSVQHAPIELPELSLQLLPLQQVAAELRQEKPYPTSGKNARSLVRGPGLTVVLVALEQGRQLQEHPAPGPAVLTVLEGRIEFRGPGGQPCCQVNAGQSLAFAADLPHAVEALEDALFQLAIGCRA